MYKKFLGLFQEFAIINSILKPYMREDFVATSESFE